MRVGKGTVYLGLTAGFAGTERYDATRHDVTGFSRTNKLLDRWLIRYAGQNQRRDAARSFVAANNDGRKSSGRFSRLGEDTTVGDLALDPAKLAETPTLEAAMRSANFELSTEPGIWLATTASAKRTYAYLST